MMGHLLTTNAILEVFTECVQSQSGQVTETFNDGRRLFVRSLLPFVEDVRPGDQMQGGVALRATDSEIHVHPYVFREVCRNGAIMAQAIESWEVEYSDYSTEDEVIQSLEEAVAICSDRNVFTSNLGRIRNSTYNDVDMALMMLPMFSQLPEGFVREILDRWMDGSKTTRFSFMNAITSTARDTPDPEDRWQLEELGGAIGAWLLPPQPSNSGGLHIDPERAVVV